tara:strand:- start:599 stop:1585 length:987 start_codon:yes stop_codon:yes gene_type:complete
MKNSNLFFDSDISTEILDNKNIVIIGYGNQGRAQALNLRDSGFNVTVALRNDSPSISKVIEDGLKYGQIDKVICDADIVCLLVPDSEAPKVFNRYIKSHLKEGSALLFSHGYNIHYNLINYPNYVDIIMVAPSGGGAMVRREYSNKSGVPALLAVEQNFTGSGLELVKAYGKAIGSSRVCTFLSTFKEETETDLYGEQVLLTGGIPMMIEKSLKVLLEDGYSPVVAWFVCYYEVKMIVDLFHEKGIEYLYRAISDTARYGGLKVGDYLIDDEYEIKLKKVLSDIKTGEFKKDLEKNIDNKSYTSSINSKHVEEFSNIMNVLFEKNKNS